MPPKKGKEPPVAEDAFKETSLTVGSPKTLVLALQSDEPGVAAKACEALEKFAELSDKNKDVVVEIGAVELLVGLLTSEHEDLRHLSSMCLATVTLAYKPRLAVRKGNFPLVENSVPLLAADASVVAQENAAHILANMASEYSTRLDMVKRGVVPAIVQLLASPVPDVLQHSLQLLVRLLAEYDVRQSMVELGALEPVIALLDSEYNRIQALALKAVGAAAKNKTTRRAIYELGALGKLLAYVENEKYHSTHADALASVANILPDPAALQKVSEQGVPSKEHPNGTPAPVASLMVFIRDAEEAVRIQGMSCVARAAAHAGNRRILMDLKAEAAVVGQVTPDDPKAPVNVPVSVAACNAISALAGGKSNSEKIGSLEVVPRLLKLLSHADSECVTAAAAAIASLVADVPLNRILVADAGGASLLVGLLGQGAAEAKRQAALALASLASTESTRQRVCDAQPLDALKGGFLSPDAKLQSACAAGVAILCRDQDFRDKMSASGMFEALVPLVTSRDELVRQSSTRIIGACAVDPRSAEGLCTAGALVALQRAASSVSHPSRLIDGAYEQLLASNPSAKYAVTGRLSITDRTGGVFYDPGRLGPGQAMPALKDLFGAPVDTRRPTLLVNSAEAAGGEDGDWTAPVDDAFLTFAAEVTQQLKGVAHLTDKVAHVAQRVARRMGGAVPRNELSAVAHQLAASELKLELQSNVLPIGQIHTGIYFHRAVLVKVLCDASNLDTALFRAEYGRAFNVLYLPEPHVVDVMHRPGALIKVQDIDDLISGQEDPFTNSNNTAPLEQKSTLRGPKHD